MKQTLLVLSFIACFLSVEARHITGGEITYTYLGPGTSTGSTRFKITLMLFRDRSCMDCAPMPAQVAIGIFNNYNNARVGAYVDVNLGSTQVVPINPLPPCITNAPDLRYDVGFYTFTVELPDNVPGYTATYQTCCRISNINNVPDGVGATYTTAIPGMLNRPGIQFM
jgi:hypothetical protein